jgi:hypothetical protein
MHGENGVFTCKKKDLVYTAMHLAVMFSFALLSSLGENEGYYQSVSQIPGSKLIHGNTRTKKMQICKTCPHLGMLYNTLLKVNSYDDFI